MIARTGSRARVAIALALSLALSLPGCPARASRPALSLPEGWATSRAPTTPADLSADVLRSARSVRVCERGTCTADTRPRPDAPLRGETWVLEPGTTLRVDEDPDADALAVILAGTGHAHDPRDDSLAPADDRRVSPWSALRSRGGGLIVTVPDDGPPLALVLVIAREPAPVSPPDATEQTAPSPAPDEASRREVNLESMGDIHPVSDPPRLERAPPDEPPWSPLDGESLRARVLFQGPGRASMALLLGGGRAAIAEHAHADAHEVFTLVSGDGMLRVLGQDERSLGHQSVMRPGDPQVIAPGARHGWVPGGTLPLVAVLAFGPPGPERALRPRPR